MTTDETLTGELPSLGQEGSAVAMFSADDPRKAYAELHATCPLSRTPLGRVVVTRMAHMHELNRNVDVLGSGGESRPRGTMGAERPLIPLDIDGEEHRMFRRLLDPLFAPKRVRLLEDTVRHEPAHRRIRRRRSSRLIKTVLSAASVQHLRRHPGRAKSGH